MYKNYFYLLRAAIELNSLFKEKSIIECYTQEKDKLFIHLPTFLNPENYIIVSTYPQEFYIQIKTEHHKAKKNTINFFNDFLPQQIDKINIALGERVIKFYLNSGSFFFLFRGNKTNCFFQDTFNNLHAFKKTDKAHLKSFNNEFSSLEFIDNEDRILEKLFTSASFKEIKSLPYLPKEIIKEVENKKGTEVSAVINCIKEIILGKIAVGLYLNTGEIIFKPLSFLDSTENIEVEIFDSFFDAISRYLFLKQINKRNNQPIRNVESAIDKELSKISDCLNNLKIKIEKGSSELKYKKYGELLLSNVKLIKKGMKELTLTDYISNNPVTIKIEPKLSAQKNIDYYFKKSRSEKIEFEKAKELFVKLKLKYDSLAAAKKELENTKDEDSLLKIKKQLKMSDSSGIKNEKSTKIPFRHYMLQGKYHVYVGKDSKNNDLLTTRFTKPNDYWFHARSVSGSHVVLKVENSKEPIPKNILEKIASIAAFYSKSKTSKIAPVAYTFKKYVVKNKKHEPGQVSVTKEKVLLVRPEIPSDCELLTD